MAAHDLKAGIGLPQNAGGLGIGFLGGAQQEEAQARLDRHLGGVMDEIGGGAALGDGRAGQKARGEDRCLAIGMNDHLAKPIDPTALAATLARWYEERPGASAPAPAPAKDGTDALPPIPGVNTTQGLARMAGNQALYRRLLLRFVDTQTATGEHIRQALAEGDITAAEHLAHTLKGVAGNIGAEVLQQKATALDQALRRNDGQEQKLESLRQRLAEELAAVTGAVAAALAEEGGPAPTQAAPLDADQRHRARQLLAELAEQLEASEIHAGQLFRESRALLAGLLPPADLTGLEKAIADYDYDRALNIARAHL